MKSRYLLPTKNIYILIEYG